MPAPNPADPKDQAEEVEEPTQFGSTAEEEDYADPEEGKDGVFGPT